MVHVKINDREMECAEGLRVLDVALKNGIDIPTLFYNPLFDEARSARCRICLVEIVAGGKPGLQSSCAIPVSEGLSVMTNSKAVYEARKTVLQLILADHVLDCRKCATSSDCDLAKLCKDYDVDGVPVCSECRNKRGGCILSRGEVCLGPITRNYCSAFCTNNNYRCGGCCTLSSSKSVLRYGIKQYMDMDVPLEEVRKAASIFSSREIALLDEVIKEMTETDRMKVKA
jgi:predicted molibdopterin-dependent oxidoreductase YjgC